MTGYFGAIEKQTLQNDYFRKVLFTGRHAQLVVMSLKRGEEIGNEVHSNVDQFFRIERGEAKFVLNDNETHVARNGDAVIVPAGTYHNVINTGEEFVKLFNGLGVVNKIKKRGVNSSKKRDKHDNLLNVVKSPPEGT